MWNLVPSGRLPLYRQISELIEKHLATGLLAPGERLPAERRLAQLLGVNRTTVIRATDDLVERGVLARRQGSGTYVNSEKWGVQNYALLNWQGPSLVLSGKRETAFLREAEIARDEAQRTGQPFYTLSEDGLPPELLPNMGLPQWSWEEMVRAEKADEASRLGLMSLRRSVQRFLHHQRGLSVPLEEILITSGSRQALFLMTQCLLRPGDSVGVEAPSYFYSLPVFQAAGLRLFALPLDSGGVCMDGLESVARRHSLKMIFLNPIFHNPTGTVMKDARKKAVLRFCARARIPVVEDDASSLLHFGKEQDLSPIKAHDKQNQVIYVGSLSSYAGRNLRAGWLVAPPAVISRLADVRLMMDAGLSVLPQILAAEYLDHVADSHLPAIRTALARRAAALRTHLTEHLGDRLTLLPTRGGLFVYGIASETAEEKRNALRNNLLRCGVLPTHGEAFGDSRCGFRFNLGYYRLQKDSPQTP